MKKICIFLVICGISMLSFGQGESSYSIILNDDTSPLRITLENAKFTFDLQQFVFDFQQTDTLTITVEEIEPLVAKKSIVITSDSKDSEILIGTFDKLDLNSDNSYILNVIFDQLSDKLVAGKDDIYKLVVKDDKEQQILLRFKLL